jgi:hypothetical protein
MIKMIMTARHSNEEQNVDSELYKQLRHGHDALMQIMMISFRVNQDGICVRYLLL